MLFSTKHAFDSAKAKWSEHDASAMIDQIDVPPPVYFCTVEPQFEIVKDRLKREYKLNAYFGPLNIGYKETPTVERLELHSLRKELGEKRINVDVGIRVEPTAHDTEFRTVRIDRATPENGLAELSH